MKKIQDKIGYAVSEFYPDFAQSLVQGVEKVLQPLYKLGEIILLEPVKVPGCSELPLALNWLFEHHDCSAVIGLGVVIRGETTHYDSVCRIVEQGFVQVQTQNLRPVISGVIMAESEEQVIKRLSSPHKGVQAAEACLMMMEAHKKVLSLS